MLRACHLLDPASSHVGLHHWVVICRRSEQLKKMRARPLPDKAASTGRSLMLVRPTPYRQLQLSTSMRLHCQTRKGSKWLRWTVGMASKPSKNIKGLGTTTEGHATSAPQSRVSTFNQNMKPGYN